MTAALIILSALFIAGTVLFIFDKKPNGGEAEPADEPVHEESGCCGLHLVCEKDSLIITPSDSIEYYDDEELDIYRGTPADGYSEEAIEQFRDILLTLLPSDIAGWAKSIQRRGIELPTPVRDELLMIVSESRSKL